MFSNSLLYRDFLKLSLLLVLVDLISYQFWQGVVIFRQNWAMVWPPGGWQTGNILSEHFIPIRTPRGSAGRMSHWEDLRKLMVVRKSGEAWYDKARLPEGNREQSMFTVRTIFINLNACRHSASSSPSSSRWKLYLDISLVTIDAFKLLELDSAHHLWHGFHSWQIQKRYNVPSQAQTWISKKYLWYISVSWS